ncbi:MAG: hypothetical protein M3N08_00560 [Pseudomonadota bacterium]|nr:hypothetical protein [Pseudomonadota bacterium]
MAVTLFAACLSACATQSVGDSRQLLLNRFANHPLDEVVMAWGAPQNETRLTNGTKVLTYRRMRTTFTNFGDFYDVYARSSECDATFMAAPPTFLVGDIILEGDTWQCADMGDGRSGPASPAPSGF